MRLFVKRPTPSCSSATIGCMPATKSWTTFGASAPGLQVNMARMSMVARLLDRQISLLEYLTSSGAIFGADGAACPDQALHGFDHGLLRLEACFSHEKRMEKIQAVFPLTFRLLADARAEIVRDFTEACPPIDISRIENARQFHDFLCTRWRRRSPEPPYLRA